MATSPEPHEPHPEPAPPEVPMPPSPNDPQPDEPIDPTADLPPETVNEPQEDEDAQSQTFAAASGGRRSDDYGLEDSTKVSTGDPDDDVQDLVDHIQDMVHSGRIDMDAYRDERNDDDEEGTLGPSGERD
jgi:hypothetical protein